MQEVKKVYQPFNIIGTISLAMTIPLIIYKVFKAVCLKKCYNALAGKVVVITGASSGLGEALSHEFYKHGCQIVLCARRRQELERVRTELLKTHPTVPTYPPIIVPLDLSDIKSLAGSVGKILGITGHIDILINNGGISSRGSVLKTDIDVDVRLMYVNYFGAVALTKAVLPHMVKRNDGHIVFVSSVQGLIAIPERSSYSATKHALQAFGDSLRAEVAQHNVNVTVVSPGYVKTELSMNALTENGAKHGQMDGSTERGFGADYVAQKIMRAVVQKEKEVVISTLVPRIAVFLRKAFPSLFFYVMTRRARTMGSD